jgi:hypothetical protein
MYLTFNIKNLRMKKYYFLFVFFLTSVNSFAQTTHCAQPTSFTDLDIANVRARIMIGGDMWWDLVAGAKYEVPKGSGKNSLSAGALWIGGKDQGGNLKIAAQTYHQSGCDFWPGPIDTSTVSIDSVRCAFYNQHWKITRQEVWDFIHGGTASPAIINWPGNGNSAYGEAPLLAPFYDANGDGIYDYTNGDYPKYEFGTQSADINNRLNGDQTIWWVFNDVGNIHTETNGAALGVEIHTQAYAFCSSDTDLSNTTFYSYKIINRSASVIQDAYIGNWTDEDLGYYLDDYVGCDVGRSMGYAYNGDNNDNLPTGYGNNLAAIGIDVLEGPEADSLDGKDNDRDSIVDEAGEHIIMSKFVVYYNDASLSGNPSTAADYYNYLDGRWRNGNTLIYGGTGFDPNNQTDTSDFIFPGNSDPNHYGTYGVNYGYNWSETFPAPGQSPNNPGDRRFVMSSGKFSLYAGQVKYMTKAAIWVQPGDSIPDSTITALQKADDRIQSFFDSYFNNIPTCPLTIGIDELSPTVFSLYPSPASEFISLHLKDNYSKIQFNVYSADGKLVYQQKLKSNDLNVDVSKWSEGVYFFHLACDNKSATGKVSIIRK